MRRLTPVACTLAAAMALAIAAPAAASTTNLGYRITDSSTNPYAGAGNLSPGSLSGFFSYDSSNNTYSAVSLNFEGLQSTDLNGQYKLDTGYTSNSTNLIVQGITASNSGGQSNENSFLDIQFASALGKGSDQITSITSVAGNAANLTTPPSVAFAAAVPEPATWAMMLLGLGAIGATLRSGRRTRGAALA